MYVFPDFVVAFGSRLFQGSIWHGSETPFILGSVREHRNTTAKGERKINIGKNVIQRGCGIERRKLLELCRQSRMCSSMDVKCMSISKTEVREKCRVSGEI